MAKERLDVALVRRGLVGSREKARALVLAGSVRSQDRVLDKPGALVAEDAPLSLEKGLPYVSRGGLKLSHALEAFGLDVQGRVALDVGASTGGFTDCLLQQGVKRVYAVDVGYGLMDLRLRQDPRVVLLERQNIRHLSALPEMMDLATIDVSFISLEIVIPAVVRLLKEEGYILALVKPQFEAGRRQVGKGGVVRDPAVHRAVLERLCRWAQEHALVVRGMTASPLLGPAGNREFFLYLDRKGESLDTAAAIDSLLGSEGAKGR
jgi:23S rRNA (cytidine1920-2'-O)/16S rRNA (cytidine1409-2'-O)-methyltransferase